MARKGFSNMKPKKGNNDSLRLEEVVEFLKLTDHPDTWVQVRFLEGDILPVKRHWIRIYAGAEKKVVGIPRFCISFNPENEEEPLDAHCPYCDLSTEGGKDATMRNEFFYLVNAIVRDIQEDEPARKSEPTSKEKKSGYKDIKSRSWTPVRVLRLTNTLVARAQELGETNIVKKKGKKVAYDISHPKFGCDVNIKFKPKASGSEKYSMDKVEGRTPLTEEEMEYLVWALTPDILDLAGRTSEKQAAEDFKRMELVGGDSIDDDADEDDEDDIDLDDDDLTTSKKKKAKKSSKSKKSALDDEDDDDDDDDDDDLPKKKKAKKSSKPSKKKKKKAFDDDDDEDDLPKKKKAKKSSKKKSALDDDDDDLPKKKKSVKKKKAALDDDDDEDDLPKKKKKSKSEKSTKKSKKKKSKAFDDDDWDDDE